MMVQVGQFGPWITRAFIVGLALVSLSCSSPAPSAPAPTAAAPSAPAPATSAPSAPAPTAAAPSAPAPTAVAPSAPAPTPIAMQLKFGANTASSSFYPYFVSVAKVITAAYPELKVTVLETNGVPENLRGLSRGEQQFGVAGARDAFQAYKGLGSYAGNAQPKLRYLWSYGVNPQHINVRTDAEVRALKELNGKSYSPGQTGTSTAALTEGAFKALGIAPNWFKGSWADILSGIKQNRSVGYTKGSGGFNPDAQQLELATSVKLRIVGFTDEEIAKVIAANPDYPFITVPANSMKAVVGEHAPYKTLAIASGVTATSDLPEEVAYRIVKAVMENRGPQDEAFKGVQGVDFPRTTIDTAMFPLHAGAVRYYREKGIVVPAEFIPPEVK